jgi:hypothetical protein
VSALPCWMQVRGAHRWCDVRGARWATNGHCAFAVEPGDGAEQAGDKDALEKYLVAVRRPAGAPEIVNGWAVFAGVSSGVYKAHFLAFAERRFPGVAWTIGSVGVDDEAACVLIGDVDGRPVAVVMPAVGGRECLLSDGGVGGYPHCEACDGTGGDFCCCCDRGDKCAACAGSGVDKSGVSP